MVIPLLSILEQNAKVWRSFIGDGCAVLEHHSNVVRDQNILDLTPPDISETGIQNWNAPIIITTLVQFLNTLFAGQTSAVRRMAALRNSVIVIDEVQSVPRNMLTLFNLAMNYLAVFCGCIDCALARQRSPVSTARFIRSGMRPTRSCMCAALRISHCSSGQTLLTGESQRGILPVNSVSLY